MAHDKNCLNCGKAFTGNINREFCSDACRKYFSRHGQTSLTGLKLTSDADKGGQVRTTPRAGGSSVSDYAAKKGIDLIAQMISGSITPVKSAPLGLATTPIDTPLQIVTPGKSINDPYSRLLVPQVVLTKPFATFLGKAFHPFKMLVWGLPGSGKSTFCMQLANELAAHQSVTYIAGEEALESPTLLDKQDRTLNKANKARCAFINRLPKTNDEWKKALQIGHPLRPYGSKAVFYDSVTKLDISPFYVNAAAHEFQLPDFAKQLSHIFITHAHKDGKQYRGDGSWGHEVDVIVRVEKGVAITEKNRFGEVGRTLKVF